MGGQVISIPAPGEPEGHVSGEVISPTPGHATHTARVAITTPSTARITTWYHRKAQQDDLAEQLRGQVPRRRYNKRKEFYACGKCGLRKGKDTGQTQYKGRWHCPHDSSLAPVESGRQPLWQKKSDQ